MPLGPKFIQASADDKESGELVAELRITTENYELVGWPAKDLLRSPREQTPLIVHSVRIPRVGRVFPTPRTALGAPL